MKTIRLTKKVELPPVGMSGWFPDEEEEIEYWLKLPYLDIWRDYDSEYESDVLFGFGVTVRWKKLFAKKRIITMYIYESKGKRRFAQ